MLTPAHGVRSFASVDRLARPLHIAGKSTKPGRAQRAEMPMIDVSATDEIANDARARSNVMRLAAAQAATGANSGVVFATRAARREFRGDFRHRLDRRRDAGAEHLARDRAALDVCGGACERHAADRCYLA